MYEFSNIGYQSVSRKSTLTKHDKASKQKKDTVSSYNFSGSFNEFICVCVFCFFFVFFFV